MRCVMKSGYLNFRMRALLVSFLTHHLWQNWQDGVVHLAKNFFTTIKNNDCIFLSNFNNKDGQKQSFYNR